MNTATKKTSVARAFGLLGDGWKRHANPASVWTRFAALPLLALSIWSRQWFGWLSLIPIALSIAWVFANPLFFPPPRSTRNWASRGVLGERVWTGSDRASLPAQFRSPVPSVIQGLQCVGMVALVYGLIVFDPIASVTGLLLAQVAKAWYIDRMVLLFDDVKDRPEYATWDY